MSSGGIWFALLTDTPPMIKASWRLTLTAFGQVPGFIMQWRAASPAVRRAWQRAGWLMAVTGAVLALHFDAWSASINLTSLTHSLLFVCATPLLLVATAASRAGVAKLVLPRGGSGGGGCLRRAVSRLVAGAVVPTPLEVVGTLVGTGAACGLALGAGGGGERTTGSDPAPTVAGDAVALLGAAAMGVYLSVGVRLRTWMPLFLYALPVTAAAAAASTVAALAFEPAVRADGSGVGPAGVLGWAGDASRFRLTAGAALVSGLAGHTLCNYALVHIPGLVVSVALLAEPIIGSALGWAVGVQGVPNAATLVAGPFLLVGAALVTIGAPDSPATRRLRAAASDVCASRRRHRRTGATTIITGRDTFQAPADAATPAPAAAEQ